MKRISALLFALSLLCLACQNGNSPANDKGGGRKVEKSNRFIIRENGKYGYMDKEGNVVINPQFDYAEGFSEGLASVRIGDRESGKYGYIDKEGKMVINPQFDLAWRFSEGLAKVEIGGKRRYRKSDIERLAGCKI